MFNTIPVQKLRPKTPTTSIVVKNLCVFFLLFKDNDDEIEDDSDSISTTSIIALRIATSEHKENQLTV